MFAKRSLFVLSLSAVVAACGGGGGGETESGSTENNPLEKYAGTYYVCNENEKIKLTLTVDGANSLNAILATDVYSNDNCSGSVIGSYKWTTPARLTYKGETSVTMPPVTLLPYSDKVDEVTMSTAGVTAQLTGSGVDGNCVNYAYTYAGGSIDGQSCFDLTFPSTTVSGALYLTADSKYLVQFSRENGVLSADDMFSTDPSFNYTMLVLDK